MWLCWDKVGGVVSGLITINKWISGCALLLGAEFLLPAFFFSFFPIFLFLFDCFFLSMLTC